jgi:hypothetical protein
MKTCVFTPPHATDMIVAHVIPYLGLKSGAISIPSTRKARSSPTWASVLEEGGRAARAPQACSENLAWARRWLAHASFSI